MARFYFLSFICITVLSAAAIVLPASTKIHIGDPVDLQKRDDNLPARVPYVFPEPGTDPVRKAPLHISSSLESSLPLQIADEIRARRANGALLALDGALLNAPLVAETWNNLFAVIRSNNSIPASMRELFILRIAVLNNASYEWIQHEPVGRAAGLNTTQLLAIRLTPPFFKEQGIDLTDTLGPELVAALEFTDHITKNVAVPNSVFNALAGFLNDTQIVEAVATTGGYNFVSRFVKSLDVDGKMDVLVPIPE